MTLYPIETGNFKLDGGAMFGVVPKNIWNNTNPADSNNMIDMAARSLLIEDGDKLILIDTGMGNKQSEKFFGYYYQWGDHSLDKSLAKYGFHRDDITDVFMTHLHFDHCGGSIQWNKDRTGYEPAFKNAHFWTNEEHWQWAIEPNVREKASFFKENLLPMEESGQLKFIARNDRTYIEKSELGFGILFVDGHTDKQMLPHIQYKGKTLVFAADLLPTTGHIPVPYVMGYDTRPLLSMDEKQVFMDKALSNDYYLFLEHDAHHQICTLKDTAKGARLDKIYTFDDLFN
ncbi:MBL fold metallo-hydrolase [Maribacter polysiphoniae]|uniref:Glyoxylase-like metal-dependent hydrolase (Beta-lactamase superfamily II) n=1 Tax=Maribacter polysiphoniae TaxID=429344 RepID=A0A316E611_9FLAO|nr:MBL fold metallo-hydrolase [Maribacter polysiphoniae]MBD1260066.1 MBL fold metallo-hydrolase [Maribacter polysiphoniae]PWK25525.1 glyoxylase-like metal-dependent hydrolase (beta-lactamase superfamily II) [Maribacter polysiphoniae]